MDVMPDICPSYSPVTTPVFAVDSVKFGDGYEQRRPAGLNSVTEEWQVPWENLSQEDYQTLYQFLVSRLGVHAFLWQAPWDNEIKKWVCTDISSTRPTAWQRGSIQATFREDHNP